MAGYRTVFFAGGGTGGHVFPAVAVCQRIVERDAGIGVHIICSRRPIDRQILEPIGIPFTCLPAVGLGRGPGQLARFLCTFRSSYRQAIRLLTAGRAAAVIGVGGFVAAPVCMAAHRLHLPIFLINVDYAPGKANRLIARWANKIFVQFEQTKSAFQDAADRVLVTGCPLRAEFDRPDPARARQELGLDPALKVLLVTGASSGAMNINEAVIRLLPKLDVFNDRWHIVHLTGMAHLEQVCSGYHGARIRHAVVPFYRCMADLYAASDLAIGRSGAVSVAEYAVSRLPSICMPYPYHRDRHQYLNAKVLADAGAAVIVDDLADADRRAEGLWGRLAGLLEDGSLRDQMAAACGRIAKPGAARQIADAILDHIQ
ncbi:MAG: UDP-N-acetylglucosamine--N-acetylmuramyl-(pentapeptide) pyrophosphoryl-undecaprenol N-acetylglucosamine transferase, partial [Sedimentisphaerales bacterium]|nr:UDP-N-acetylglucosamine--N-acetylmuramyl-(pentapeptide) pyrophosphoryl-undecaprenol N-acetylglucosamine transferase [Sedimentisphaerales bacterium]